MPHSKSPWLVGEQGLVALENISPSFPQSSLLQDYKGHGDILSLRTIIFSQKMTHACHCHPEQSHSKGMPSPGCSSYTENALEDSPGQMSQAVGAPLQTQQTKTGSFRANFISP